MRQRLQIMHGRQYGNLHHLLQLEGRAIGAGGTNLPVTRLVSRPRRDSPDWPVAASTGAGASSIAAIASAILALLVYLTPPQH